jgi:hypothetical protein
LSSAIRPPAQGGASSNLPQHGNLPENYQDMPPMVLPQYMFDITDFIADQIGKSGHNKWALSLLIPATSRENTIQKLVFGDQRFGNRSENQNKDNRLRLEITYATYND